MKLPSLWAALVSVALLLSGCASSKSNIARIDWNSRLGHYTFDEAITEIGPPEKSATLSDGSLVAEWFVKQKAGSSVSFGVGSYGGGYGSGTSVGVGQTVGNIGGGAEFLRLTFGADGQLRAADKFVR